MNHRPMTGDVGKRLMTETAAVLEDGQLTQEIERDMFQAQQKTIQAELHQNDLYTKRTRPKIARQSWYVTATYAILSSFLPVLPASWGLQAPVFEWQIFLVLASPALTYMGVRGLDKWKNGSK